MPFSVADLVVEIGNFSLHNQRPCIHPEAAVQYYFRFAKHLDGFKAIKKYSGELSKAVVSRHTIGKAVAHEEPDVLVKAVLAHDQFEMIYKIVKINKLFSFCSCRNI